jgi:hypothetical protein
MTFDIMSDVYVGIEYDWKQYHEATCRCRHCHRPSIMLIGLSNSSARKYFGADGRVAAFEGDVGKLFGLVRVITIADMAAKPAPEHLPMDIARAFDEGTRCLSIGCINAAASMFRLCLDLTTKGLLPRPDAPNGPSKRERFNLGPRLDWLFASGGLPADLEVLSTVVKDNGNDGAHDGNLSEADADDLYDFAFAVLERLYTQPARLDEAKARREGRKAKKMTEGVEVCPDQG